MLCSHCHTDFHAKTHQGSFDFTHKPRLPTSPKDDPNLFFNWQTTVCSKCNGAHIYLNIGRFKSLNSIETEEYRQIYPKKGSFRTPPIEVPEPISKDFSEANEVLSVSPKAAAALARRCLQTVLANQGYTGRDLVKQVEAVLSETDTTKALPPSLNDNIDAIRNFGNFSAHPITDQTTLQIVDVEDGEAEWCLEILLDLFNHYYVAPAASAKKRAGLAAKLAAAGKPPMKS